MNLLLVFITLIISFAVIKIGAIALELTGLEASLAQFQAISCFTGTGFTTKESELIAVSPHRRRIAAVLMIVGNIVMVTLVATLANSLRTPNIKNISIPFLHLVFPASLQPLITLLLIGGCGYFLYKLFSRAGFGAKLKGIIRARIVKRKFVQPVTFEELMVATGGYGVSSVEVCEGNHILGKTLSESGLRKRDITILAIERADEIISHPTASTKIMLGDRLVCFGKLYNIRRELRECHLKVSTT